MAWRDWERDLVGAYTTFQAIQPQVVVGAGLFWYVHKPNRQVPRYL